MSTISPQEVGQRLERGDDLFLLDIRERDDFEDWHIPGSHNIPCYDALAEGNDEALESCLNQVPADREVVTVCIAGIVAEDATDVLDEHGYEARTLQGGMRAWGKLYQAYDVPVDGITQIVRPGTGCLSYLVSSDGEAVVVDPGMHIGVYTGLAEQIGLEIVAAVDTHAHADHISGGQGIASELGATYYLPPKDAGEREDTEPIAGGDEIAVGERSLRVIDTPGHTSGSITLRWGRGLLTGDTLFVRSVGRPDLEGGGEAVEAGARQLFASLRELAEYPGETMVLPGHFDEESMRPVVATLDDVRRQNELMGVDDEERFVGRMTGGLPEEPANFNEIKAINTGHREVTNEAEDLELGPNNCASN